MTSQNKRTPKTSFHFKITNENYDLLCRVALRNDVSVASLLNCLIQKSATTICEPYPERITLNSNGRRNSYLT